MEVLRFLTDRFTKPVIIRYILILLSFSCYLSFIIYRNRIKRVRKEVRPGMMNGIEVIFCYQKSIYDGLIRMSR